MKKAKIDLLIVDEMGKNINGAGMDPLVIGRPTIQKPAERPHVRHLFVRDLTPESEGNAIGIGFALGIGDDARILIPEAEQLQLEIHYGACLDISGVIAARRANGET